MRVLLACLWLARLPLRSLAGPTVVDDLGRRITLPRPPRRIISLATSMTEILFAVGAGKKIIGDRVCCDYV